MLWSILLPNAFVFSQGHTFDNLQASRAPLQARTAEQRPRSQTQEANPHCLTRITTKLTSSGFDLPITNILLTTKQSENSS